VKKKTVFTKNLLLENKLQI